MLSSSGEMWLAASVFSCWVLLGFLDAAFLWFLGLLDVMDEIDGVSGVRVWSSGA